MTRWALALCAVLACGRGETGNPAPSTTPPPSPREAPPAPAPGPAPAPTPTPPAPLAPFIVEVLQALEPLHPDVIAHPERYRFQFVVTRFSTGDLPEETWSYRAGDEYVYPASAIKTFASVGALLALQDARATRPRLSVRAVLARCPSHANVCPAMGDASNLQGGIATLEHEIRKMHLVSDNDAFNLLYDIVGHEALNQRFWDLGFSSLRMRHRMYSHAPDDAQRRTPRLQLSHRGQSVEIPARQSALALPANEGADTLLGTAYIDPRSGQRVDEPMDFSEKNAVSIRDLHRLTVSIVRPGSKLAADLGLDGSSRELLVEAMTADPLESKNPVYTGEPLEKGKRRYKPMYIGVERVVPERHLVYANKAGKAYGFLVDSAVIENRKNARAMAVTVSIYANENGVLNDDVYGYAEVSRPVLRDLGEALARRLLVEKNGPASPPPQTQGHAQ